MSIELDMFLILKQAKNQDFIREYESDGITCRLYLKPGAFRSGKGFYVYGVEKGKSIEQPAFIANIIEVGEGFELAGYHMAYPGDSSPDDFKFEVLRLLYDFNLQNVKKDEEQHGTSPVRKAPDEVPFETPEFSKEEVNFFGENVPEIIESIRAGKAKPLGWGGFRTVYDLGDFVLKVANWVNDPEMAKEVNKSESDPSLQSMFPDLMIKTYKHAPDYSWVIQDKVIRQANKRDFFMHIPEFQGGFGLGEIVQTGQRMLAREPMMFQGDWVDAWKESSDVFKQTSEKFKRLSKFTQQLVLFAIRTGTDVYDLYAKNFGIIKRNGKEQLVLLDAGTHYHSGSPTWYN